MASTGNAMSVSQPALPIFKRVNYDFWSIKIQTLFRSRELCELVEKGYQEPDDEAQLRENKRKDSKTVFHSTSCR